jgi:hypothetical protein
MLWNFKLGYFDYFALTGGHGAHITYRSGEVDPKVAAYQWAQSRVRPVIYTKEWRTYCPIKYLASRGAGTRVETITKNRKGKLTPQEFSSYLRAAGAPFLASLRNHDAYVIGFSDHTFDNDLRSALPGITLNRKDFTDSAGLAVISAWFVEKALNQS